MASIDDLLLLMAHLRDPESGCSWDLKQNFQSIASYTLEEACEVVDAIDRHDYEGLREELGDLLFQIVFHARMAQEKGYFNFQQVVDEQVAKMIRRHPHVFPDGTLASEVTAATRLTPEQIEERWQQIKALEQQAKLPQADTHSVLPDDLPATLPALIKALKIQQAAARVGFDWQALGAVEEKITEELQEVRDVLHHQEGQERIMEEVGDLLFAMVNYARHLKVEPEAALRCGIKKFEHRFKTMAALITSADTSFEQLTPAEMEAFWQQAKKSSRQGAAGEPIN